MLHFAYHFRRAGLFLLATLGLASWAFAQTTTTPTHTLPIGAKRATLNVLGALSVDTMLRLPSYGALGTDTVARTGSTNKLRTEGAVLYDKTGKRVLVFDGTRFKEIGSVNNIYENDGTLTSDRKITLGGKTLTITNLNTSNYLKIEAGVINNGNNSNQFGGIWMTEQGNEWGWKVQNNATSDSLEIATSSVATDNNVRLSIGRSGDVNMRGKLTLGAAENIRANAFNANVAVLVRNVSGGLVRQIPADDLPNIYTADGTITNTTFIGNDQNARRITIPNDRQIGFVGPGAPVGTSGENSNLEVLTLRMRNNNGLVGIGTRFPESRFHVKGNTILGGTLRVDDKTELKQEVSLGFVAQHNDVTQLLALSGNTIAGKVQRVPIKDLKNVPNLYTKDGSIPNARVVTLNSNSLTFKGNGTNNDIFLQGANGRVGIGTTSPVSKLHVVGAVRADSLVLQRLGRIGSTGTTDSLLVIGTDNVVKKVAPATAVVTNTIYNQDGTINADRTITINRNQSVMFRGQGATGTTGGTPHFLRVNGANGFVSIGTSSPRSALHVVGAVRADSLIFNDQTKVATSNASNDQMLVLGTDGIVKKRTIPASVTPTNIYNTSSTLEAARVVGLNSHNLTFQNTLNSTTEAPALVIQPNPARVGIGTRTTEGTLHVVGRTIIDVSGNNLTLRGIPSAMITAVTTATNPNQILTITNGNNIQKISADNLANIYTKDGTLQARRTVTMGSNSLTFTSTGGNGIIINGTGGGNKLSVTGNTNLTGQLTVANQTNLNGATIVNNSFTANNTSNLEGLVRLGNVQLNNAATQLLVLQGTNTSSGQIQRINISSLPNIYNQNGTINGERQVRINSGGALKIGGVQGGGMTGHFLLVRGNDGHVGIGTSNPTQALTVVGNADIQGDITSNGVVRINGAASNIKTAMNRFTVGNNSGPTFPVHVSTSSTTGVSIGLDVRSGANIGGQLFVGNLGASSDKRIKNIRSRLSEHTQEALATIEKINVTDYTYKDELEKGNRMKRGVIAQELEKVLPEAVTIKPMPEVVPDIYQYSESIHSSGGELVITLAKAHGVKAGDTIQVIGAKENLVPVLRVQNERTFIVPAVEPNKQTNKVFVYGREVRDFRTVDYNYIMMTNVAATQALKKENDALKKRVKELSALETRVDELNALVKELLKTKVTKHKKK